MRVTLTCLFLQCRQQLSCTLLDVNMLQLMEAFMTKGAFVLMTGLENDIEINFDNGGYHSILHKVNIVVFEGELLAYNQ